jgi:hypothetical protein
VHYLRPEFGGVLCHLWSTSGLLMSSVNYSVKSGFFSGGDPYIFHVSISPLANM